MPNYPVIIFFKSTNDRERLLRIQEKLALYFFKKIYYNFIMKYQFNNIIG